MPISAVSAMQAASPTNQVQSTAANKKDSTLSMDDFFKLLCAELQNQNMLDPVDNTQFVAQMAQFSTLSATQEMNSNISNFMAVSYVGKTIRAKQMVEGGGTRNIQGVAEKVEFINGETFLTVDGERVSLNEITEVAI